jgi:hypothetical protein
MLHLRIDASLRDTGVVLLSEPFTLETIGEINSPAISGQRLLFTSMGILAVETQRQMKRGA